MKLLKVKAPHKVDKGLSQITLILNEEGCSSVQKTLLEDANIAGLYGGKTYEEWNKLVGEDLNFFEVVNIKGEFITKSGDTTDQVRLVVNTHEDTAREIQRFRSFLSAQEQQMQEKTDEVVIGGNE